jgi:hypothetical protein
MLLMPSELKNGIGFTAPPAPTSSRSSSVELPTRKPPAYGMMPRGSPMPAQSLNTTGAEPSRAMR